MIRRTVEAGLLADDAVGKKKNGLLVAQETKREKKFDTNRIRTCAPKGMACIMCECQHPRMMILVPRDNHSAIVPLMQEEMDWRLISCHY